MYDISQPQEPLPIKPTDEHERIMRLSEIDKFHEDTSEQIKLLEQFLKVDDLADDATRKQFWGMFTRHVMLANFMTKNKEDETRAERNFYNMVDSYLNSLPSYKITVQMNNDMQNMKFLFPFMLSRSRDALQLKLGSTQIRQFITSDEREKPKSKGWLSRIFPFGR